MWIYDIYKIISAFSVENIYLLKKCLKKLIKKYVNSINNKDISYMLSYSCAYRSVLSTVK